jgi:O-antigen ligase
MNKIVNKVQQVLFILLGITIPTSIAITNLIIGLLVFCWFLEGNFQQKLEEIKSSKWMLSIFGLIVMYGLGMIWGDFHTHAEYQFQRLPLLLVFPVLITTNISQRAIKHGAISFLITTFISAVISIAINNNVIAPLASYMSFFSSGGNVSAFIKYNYHNVLLSLASTLSLYILIEKKTKYRKLLLLFIVAYAVSIFTERGRAGQVIFNLSALFYIMYYNRNNFLRLVTFLVVLFSFQFIVYKTTKVYKNRLVTVSNIIKNEGFELDGESEDIRYVFLRETLNRIVKKPIFGYGTGSFGTIFDNEVKTGDDFLFHKTPHNQYLYVCFELGIIGLILLLLIFYYQIKELFKKQDGIQRVLLPLSFMFLMLVDSYFFIFILTIAYIYLYTIYSKYQSE